MSGHKIHSLREPNRRLDNIPIAIIIYCIGYLKKERFMNKKIEGLPRDFGKNFKSLPLKLRIKVLRRARKLLKQQKEDKKLVKDA